MNERKPNKASIWFIGNLDAAQDVKLREVIGLLREEGLEVEMRVTWESGQTGHFCEEALKAGADAIFGCGGDGTLHELLAPVVKAGARTMMGGLPYGTGNDFLQSLGLEDSFDPLQVQHWVSKRPTIIDLGCLNGEYFLNMATIGMGAEITSEASRGLKSVAGRLAYFASAIPAALDLTTRPARVESEELNWEGELAFLFVGNSLQAGGGWRICPAASLVDGYLDVVVVPAMPLNEMFRTRQDLLEAAEPGDFGKLIYRQVKELKVFFEEEPLPINLDGETYKGEDYHFQVQPQAVPFLIP